jgi:hypothetical protein
MPKVRMDSLIARAAAGRRGRRRSNRCSFMRSCKPGLIPKRDGLWSACGDALAFVKENLDVTYGEKGMCSILLAIGL